MNKTMTMLIMLAMAGALLAALPVPLGAEQKGSVRSIELPNMPVDSRHAVGQPCNCIDLHSRSSRL